MGLSDRFLALLAWAVLDKHGAAVTAGTVFRAVDEGAARPKRAAAGARPA